MANSDPATTLEARTKRRFANKWTRMALVFSLIFLTLVLLADPGDKVLHLKVPCFMLVMALWLARVDVTRPITNLKVFVGIFVVSIVIPTVWVLLSVITGRSLEMENLLAFPKAFLFLTLLFVISNENIYLDRIAARGSVLIAVTTIVVVALSKQAPTLATGIYLFAVSNDLAVINEARDQFGIGVGQFFYNTSPIMLFGLAFFLHRCLFGRRRRVWNLGLSTLILVALLFTGGRGNLISALFVVAVLATARMAKSIGGLATAVIACVLFVVPCALLPGNCSTRRKHQTRSSSSTTNRTWNFSASIQVTCSSEKAKEQDFFPPVLATTLMLPNSPTGTRPAVWNSITLVFVILLLAPIILLLRKRKFDEDVGYVTVGYIAYLLVSATNPLLVSTGTLVSSWMGEGAGKLCEGNRCGGLAHEARTGVTCDLLQSHQQDQPCAPARISVCMATYNGAKFVRQQIESILPQLGATDEVIIVDDASTDETVEIIHQLRDGRIHLVQNARNEGAQKLSSEHCNLQPAI